MQQTTFSGLKDTSVTVHCTLFAKQSSTVRDSHYFFLNVFFLPLKS